MLLGGGGGGGSVAGRTPPRTSRGVTRLEKGTKPYFRETASLDLREDHMERAQRSANGGTASRAEIRHPLRAGGGMAPREAGCRDRRGLRRTLDGERRKAGQRTCARGLTRSEYSRVSRTKDARGADGGYRRWARGTISGSSGGRAPEGDGGGAKAHQLPRKAPGRVRALVLRPRLPARGIFLSRRCQETRYHWKKNSIVPKIGRFPLRHAGLDHT